MPRYKYASVIQLSPSTPAITGYIHRRARGDRCSRCWSPAVCIHSQVTASDASTSAAPSGYSTSCSSFCSTSSCRNPKNSSMVSDTNSSSKIAVRIADAVRRVVSEVCTVFIASILFSVVIWDIVYHHYPGNTILLSRAKSSSVHCSARAVSGSCACCRAAIACSLVSPQEPKALGSVLRR